MILTATHGSLKYDDIKAIKSVFPQVKCSTTSNRMKDVYAAETEGVEDTLPEDHEDENDVFQVVADQFQNQESYDDEEVLDVLETYQDIRRRLQQKKMGRGYKTQPTSWELVGYSARQAGAVTAEDKVPLVQDAGTLETRVSQAP